MAPTASPQEKTMPGWCAALFRPVDIAALAIFRILFGLIMVWEVLRYAAYGWIGAFYLEPEFLFTYPGFGWVKPWPGDGLYWHFAALGGLAAMIVAGLVYRLACVLFLIGFGYVFLLDQARYLNHFYLVLLVTLIMAVVPAARAWSLDALIGRTGWVPRVPAWSVWLLRFQFEVVYIFAGLVKLNGDWLRLEPMRMWLAARDDLALLGPLLTQEWVVALAAYGTIVLHIAGAPLLLWRRTRFAVFWIYAAFHLLNHIIWDIGIFPWLTLAGTLMFFEPDWPRRLWHRAVAAVDKWRRRIVVARDRVAAAPAAVPPPVARTAVVAFLGIFAALQIVLPLRHLLYPGNVSWHEQGHRFAWQMKLRQKSGMTTFLVRDPRSGETWTVDPEDYLTRRQVRYMAGRPDMIVAFAHYLEEVWQREHGVADVEVRAQTAVSLNGREPQALIDPARDLTTVAAGFSHADWIVPLHQPLRPSRPLPADTPEEEERDEREAVNEPARTQ